MNKTKVKIVAGVLVVFLLGVITGVLGTNIYVMHGIRKFTSGRPPEAHKNLLMRRLSRELDLTEDQKPQVEKILEEANVEIRAFLTKSRAEFEQIMQPRKAQLKEILTPTQQEKLDKIFARMQQRWHRPPPPPPGRP